MYIIKQKFAVIYKDKTGRSVEYISELGNVEELPEEVINSVIFANLKQAGLIIDTVKEEKPKVKVVQEEKPKPIKTEKPKIKPLTNPKKKETPKKEEQTKLEI